MFFRCKVPILALYRVTFVLKSLLIKHLRNVPWPLVTAPPLDPPLDVTGDILPWAERNHSLPCFLSEWDRAILLVHLRLLFMGTLQVRWAIPTRRGPSSWDRHTVAQLFLMAGPAVTTILAISLLLKWRSSLPMWSRLGFWLLTGETALRSMRHSLLQLWSCLTVSMLWGLLIM